MIVPLSPAFALGGFLVPLGALALILLSAGAVAARRWARARLAALTQRVEHESQARLAQIVRNSSDMVTVIDRGGIVVLQTGATTETLGYELAELLGSSFLDLIHPEDIAKAAALHADAFEPGSARQIEWRLRHSSGEWREVETSVAAMSENSVVTGAALTTRDIGTRKALEMQLRHRAFHDPLTQLPNRALFYDRLDHALAREHRDESVVGVVFVDLDDFKLTNDRYGHAGGDELLIGAAQRLRSSVRSVDTVARLGGDEFGILLGEVEGTADAVATGERVLSAFREPFMLHGVQVVIRPSMGIALSESAETTAEDMLSHADVAMYAAKSRGKGRYQLFDSQLAGELVSRLEDVARNSDHEPDRITWFMRAEEQRLEIESVLSSKDAIGTVFQPIVDLRTGGVTGYEGLSRFRSSAERPPNAWFAQATRCGLGVQLECRAVELVLARGASRPAGTYISVNVSPTTLMDSALHQVLPADLAGIVFEVTENELLAGGDRLAAAIVQLRGRGALVAIDDAGAGYAGLKHLMVLRPDIVKLDRGVVAGVSSDSAKLALIDAFVRFAREIGAVVCAEGVEELEDLTVLADLDVAFAQGYCLGRPEERFEPPLEPAVAALRRATLAAMRIGVAGDSRAGYVADRHLEIAAERLGVIVSIESIEPALEAISQALHADALCLSRLSRGGGALETIAFCGGLIYDGDYELADFPASAEVLRTGNAAQVLIDDALADPHEVAALLEEGMSSLLMVPIISGARTIGMLEVFSSELRPWSRLELARARLFGYQLGLMLEKFGLAHPAPGPSAAADLGGDAAVTAEHLADPLSPGHRLDLV